MNDIKVSDYQEEFNRIKNREECESCLTLLSWIRERLASHKRSNCTSISAEDKNDSTDYIEDSGAIISGTDYKDE